MEVNYYIFEFKELDLANYEKPTGIILIFLLKMTGRIL